MRILIIEDYAPLRKSITTGLQEAGYAVDDASDGNHGLWLAQSGNYDLIILDLMLPGLDGLSLLKQLRAKNDTQPVLILTAKDTVADRVKGLDTGADDYLVKPFAFDELLARVRARVRRNYDQPNPIIEIRDLRIDTVQRRVWKTDEELTFTAREYALLEYLAQRKGQPVSRTEIWNHLYDDHSDSTSNVVDVYIGYLRKKIDAPDRPSLITTRRGMGYVLGADL